MDKHKLIFTAHILITLVLVSCKSSSQQTGTESEQIFSLNTTSCMGECPVYELTLYGDKTLTFNGKENTTIEGEHSKVLSDENFDALLGIIEAVDWSEYEHKYTSNMSDLPTHNYTYTRDGVNKEVSKYGNEPESLSKMHEILLAFVENTAFPNK